MVIFHENHRHLTEKWKRAGKNHLPARLACLGYGEVGSAHRNLRSSTSLVLDGFEMYNCAPRKSCAHLCLIQGCLQNQYWFADLIRCDSGIYCVAFHWNLIFAGVLLTKLIGTFCMGPCSLQWQSLKSFRMPAQVKSLHLQPSSCVCFQMRKRK